MENSDSDQRLLEPILTTTPRFWIFAGILASISLWGVFAWWTQLRQATAGAWQPAPTTRADASSAALTLRAAGQTIASIDLADDSVRWCPADRSACWRAPISAAQREAWIAEVARW